MKKILTLICCTVLLAATTSCTKNYVSPATTNQTVFFTVFGGAAPSGSWKLNSAGGSPYYQATLGDDPKNPLPQLDNYIQHNGAVLVYISYDDGDTYEPVPEGFAGNSFGFIHSTNIITITSQTSDGGTAVAPQDDILVKVVLVDSNVSNQ